MGFAVVLMGLNHPVSFYGQAREVVDTSAWSWPKPPRVERSWFAVVSAEGKGGATWLDWRFKTLKDSLAGLEFYCEEVEPPLAPEIVHVTRSWVRWSDGDYTASLVLDPWPRDVSPGWLGLALSGETPVDVGLHYRPRDVRKYARYLKVQQRWQSDELRRTADAAASLGVTDATEERRKLVAGEDRPCDIAVVFTVHATSPEALRTRLQSIQYDVGLKLGGVRVINGEHDRGREATEPLARCVVQDAFKALDCTAAAYTGIFQPPTIRHKRGADIGVTHGVRAFSSGGQLLSLDPFDASLEGFSGTVVGKKRMGKSYFMKNFARRMAEAGVEVTVVEQRRPPEYAVLEGIPNFHLVNIEAIASDDDDPETAIQKRAEFLRSFLTDYWNRCRSDPRPRMLIIDEAWALLRYAQSSGWIEEVARTCGHFGLSLWVLSQQTREYLETGQAVFDNAEILVCLKQMDNDLDLLVEATGMPPAARKWLRSAQRGQALIRIGDLWIAADLARVPEHDLITTDPRDKWSRIDMESETMDDPEDDEGSSAGQRVDWRDRLDDRAGRGAAVRGRDGDRGGRDPVGTAV